MTFNFNNTPEPAFDPETAVSVGRVSSVHGLQGELKVQSLTDFPNRFDKGARLWLDGKPHVVERSRVQQSLVYLKLEGIDDRTIAETLRGKELQVPQAQPIYEKDRYYQHEIIGLDVVEADGSVLGKLFDVMATGANDVYVVRGERGELLLPAIDDVVTSIDPRAGRITVNLLPGLEFVAARPPRPRHVPHRPPSPKATQAPSAD